MDKQVKGYMVLSLSTSLYHYLSLYIYICCCVQFRGVFFSPIGWRMRGFFRAHVTNENDKNCCFPRWKVSNFQDNSPSMSTLGLSSNAFNNGALMLRNISTPLLNGHARAIFERLNSPSFHALFLRTSKSLKPLFLQRFVTISWVFLAPPKSSTITFSAHNNCKTAFRK